MGQSGSSKGKRAICFLSDVFARVTIWDGRLAGWNSLPLFLLQVVVAALLALQVKLGVLQLCRHFLAFLLQLLHRALQVLVIGLQISHLQRAHTYTQSRHYCYIWTAARVQKCGPLDIKMDFFFSQWFCVRIEPCLSLSVSFALLLRLQLVIKLLLEFLFVELHFTNGSVVFYPPLASWRKDTQFGKCLCDILGVSCLTRDEQAIQRKRHKMLRITECTALAVMVITKTSLNLKTSFVKSWPCKVNKILTGNYKALFVFQP